MTITDSEFLRYQRQVALPEIGELGQAKLRNSSILVVGCGGLGCSAIQHLAASGIGHLIIADDDVVEVSNLPRQILYSSDEIGLAKVDATKKLLPKSILMCAFVLSTRNFWVVGLNLNVCKRISF